MSASKDAAVSEADVVINRLNIALARSQKIIQSWLPPRPEVAGGESNSQLPEDDEDFKSMTEAGGIGSKAAYDDEGLPDGAFQRKKLSSNDQLLEQLLGKKAAHAKRKSREAGKSMAASKHAAPKPAVKLQRKEVASEDEEEEGGRAAAFKSRRKAVVRQEQKDGDLGMVDGGASGESLSDAGPASERPHAKPPRKAELPDRPSKRKQASYLDELLAQKASKKSKKRKKGGVNV